LEKWALYVLSNFYCITNRNLFLRHSKTRT